MKRKAFSLRHMLVCVLLSITALTARAAADPDFYIFLCFGQSNMEGAAKNRAARPCGHRQSLSNDGGSGQQSVG